MWWYMIILALVHSMYKTIFQGWGKTKKDIAGVGKISLQSWFEKEQNVIRVAGGCKVISC